MTLVLNTKSWLADMHGSVALTEWDLDQELKLQTTTDQDNRVSEMLLLQKPTLRTSYTKDDFIWYNKGSDSFIKQTPWLMVNPNIVSPIRYETPPSPALTTHNTAPSMESSSQDRPLQEEVSCCLSTNQKTDSGKAVKSWRKPRTSSKQSNSRCQPVCSSWPRPPVNYCILIGLALKVNGSLRVQQIYNFTRELFPFFQSAPGGWKNTIRHNLCFNNSFRKIFNLQQPPDRKLSCSEGKRKSCCWTLTPDGHQRLRDEMYTLSTQTLRELQQSAAHPDMIQTLMSM